MTSTAADESLLRRFLAGEDDATRQVQAWARQIVHFKSYGLSADDQLDVVQDVLSGVFVAAGRPGFQLDRGLKAFVRTVAAARCIDRLRTRRPTGELDEALTDDRPDPYAELLRKDTDARLRHAVQQLGDACRSLIREHFFEGVAYRVLAEREDRAESTLRVRMFQCMKQLRKTVSAWA